jgi:hypothetical protein
MMRRFSTIVVLAAFATAVAMVSGVWPQTMVVRAAGGLLGTAAVLRTPAQAPLANGIRRSRMIALDASQLPDPRARATSRSSRLALDVFPDVPLEATFDRFDAAANGVSWVGHIDTSPGSTVTLTYANGLVWGSVITPGGVYQIRPGADVLRAANPQPAGQLHVVEEVEQAALPREAIRSG